MTVRMGIVRWPFSLPAGMFYCLMAMAVHESMGSPAGAPAFVALVAGYWLAGTISLWILVDAGSRRRSLPYDFDTFVFFAWWVLAPVYLVRTRGWRGLMPIAWFILICIAAGTVGSIFVEMAQVSP